MNDIEQVSIERLKAASEMSLQHYGLPLVVTDSGGKDSAVIKELARRAGIPFEVMHNHTTADAPETVRFIRSEANSRDFQNTRTYTCWHSETCWMKEQHAESTSVGKHHRMYLTGGWSTMYFRGRSISLTKWRMRMHE